MNGGPCSSSRMKLPVLEQSLVLRDPSIPSFSSLLILQLNNIYVSHILFTNVISWYSHVHSRIHPMNKSQTGNSLFYISKFMLPDINNHSYLTAFFHQSCLSPKLIIFQWNKGVAEEFTTTWARDELHWSSESQMYNWIFQNPKIGYIWPLLVSVSHSDRVKEMISN